jgi:hypothetical protein
LTKNDEKQRFLQMVTPNKGFLLFSKKKKKEGRFLFQMVAPFYLKQLVQQIFNAQTLNY